MMRQGRTAATIGVLAVLGSLATLVSRPALAAQPTTLECLTAYEDSVPLRNHRQLKAARAKLVLCSAESCPAEVRAECSVRVPEIDASMPTVVFDAKDAAGTTLFAVKVKMDGNVLAERLHGSALPIDPGEHTFIFEVAGRPRVEKHLMIFEGEKLRRERVEFEAIAAPNPAPPAPAPITVVKSETPEPAPGPAAKSPLSKGKIAGLVLAGVGVAAAGVGVAYSFVAVSRRDTATGICPGDCNTKEGVEAWNRANTAGDVATGALIVGAAGIVSGVVVWLLAKPPADGAPASQVSFGPGGVHLTGRW
jgi:hypothetical protein